MSDLDLLNYYETKLGLGKSCSCQGDCIQLCSLIANDMFGDESIHNG